MTDRTFGTWELALEVNGPNTNDKGKNAWTAVNTAVERTEPDLSVQGVVSCVENFDVVRGEHWWVVTLAVKHPSEELGF